MITYPGVFSDHFGIHLSSKTKDALDNFKLTAALSIWVGALFVSTLVTYASLMFLPHPLAIACLTLQVTLFLQPLETLTTPAWAKSFIRYSIQCAVDYFPLTLHMQDAASISSDRTYVVGFEPHSALPIAMNIVFSQHSQLLPKGLEGIKGLASSAAFLTPVVRQLWWWVGMRPVSRESMDSLLKTGQSVVLCPGGVREVTEMEHGEEVVYLRRRHGFVRLALSHGASLLPAFAFGQTKAYGWVRPGPPVLPKALVTRVARYMGYVPLIMYGALPTVFLPRKVPIYIAVGQPIDVPKVSDPTQADIEKYLKLFTDAMEELYETHKGAAGYADVPLRLLR